MAQPVDYKVEEDQLQGLIFDCDGTLVDTMPAYWTSWVKTCRHYGLDFNEKRFYSYAGVPVRDIFAILISEAHHLKVKPNLDEVCATKSKYSHIAIRTIGTPRIEAVVDIVRKYHGKLPMAVASSGNREHVLATLRDNGILELFDQVVTCEDIANPKPAPDIFLLAAHRIGCDPTKCRGFEDADIGMAALHAAGMEAIDVRHTKGYPKVVPSTTSVLEIDDEVAVENIDTSAETAAPAGKRTSAKKQPESKEEESSMGLFFKQALFTAVAAYLVYLLMNNIMFEAVRDEAWDAD